MDLHAVSIKWQYTSGCMSNESADILDCPARRYVHLPFKNKRLSGRMIVKMATPFPNHPAKDLSNMCDFAFSSFAKTWNE